MEVIDVSYYLSRLCLPNVNVYHFELPICGHLTCRDYTSFRMNSHRNDILFVFLEKLLFLGVLRIHDDSQLSTHEGDPSVS